MFSKVVQQSRENMIRREMGREVEIDGYESVKKMAFAIAYAIDNGRLEAMRRKCPESDFEMGKAFAKFLHVRNIIRAWSCNNKKKTIVFYQHHGKNITTQFMHLNVDGGIDETLIQRSIMNDYNVLTGEARYKILTRLASKRGVAIISDFSPHVGSWMKDILVDDDLRDQWRVYLQSTIA